ncbi:dirigent protein 17-like [Durio zibethinus]|uniref:Dirigent protein 17-like n=1 Tax=Durio zibethinus TaxID=66656 RepID=A0A6P6ARC6_DURZI|nr:dirigent protein 17-like [Durio zibethinus]
MEKKSMGAESECGVYELPGEPAVVINGVPEVNPNCNTLVLSDVNKEDGESQKDKGCGEWLEGREVQKLFGEKYYYGSVIQFDKETGWYRVEYEDGDAEDLDWHELEEVLLPVDITIPLKTVALKLLKKNQKAPIHNAPGQLVPSGSAIQKAKHVGKKEKTSQAHGEA